MKSVRSLALVLLAVVLIVFALKNRMAVTVSLWPFPYEADLPLFVVFFFGIFFGLALASLLLAAKSISYYFDKRRVKKEMSELSKQLNALERKLDAQNSRQNGPEEGRSPLGKSLAKQQQAR